MLDATLYRRLLRQARPYWPHVAGVFALGLLASPIALLTPVPLKIVLDSVLGAHPLPPLLRALVPAAAGSNALALAIGLLLAVTVLGQLQSLATSLLRTYIGERLVLDFRSLLVQQVQRLSLSYHDTRGTTDSTYRIHYDTQSIQMLTIGGVPLLTAGIMLIAMVIATAWIDTRLALIALAIRGDVERAQHDVL